MSAFNDPDDFDVHGNEPHDVFGNHEGTDVWGNAPTDVWGDHSSGLGDHQDTSDSHDSTGY